MIGIIGDLFKTIFRPSPADRAFKKCMAASRELGTAAMMFHESFKAVGTDLQPNESALDELGRILDASQEPEQTLEGASVFLGCIITEQLGGTWQRESGSYKIVGVGRQKSTVDLSDDIRTPLSNQPRPSPREVYQSIRERVA
jgi:hypothetical protein